MTRMTTVLVALASVAAFATGCSETTSNSSTATQLPAEPAMRTGSPADEAACQQRIIAEVQTSDVVVLSSEFSQANTVVVLGVGPQRARWRCLVSGGSVYEVMSLTNEGAA